MSFSWPARAWQWLLGELKLILPPTTYFFCAFNLIIITTDLVARHYWFALSQFLFATTMALIVGKVILVTDKFSFMNRFRDAPLIKPILYKTVLYSVLVALVRLLELFLQFARDARGFDAAFQAAVNAFTWHRFIAIQVWLFVCFLIYVTVTEFNARLGEGRLARLLFGRPLAKGP